MMQHAAAADSTVGALPCWPRILLVRCKETAQCASFLTRCCAVQLLHKPRQNACKAHLTRMHLTCRAADALWL